VILVLIAGFIGQFGRMFAEAIIARIRLRHTKQHQLPDELRMAEAPSVSHDNTPQIELPQKTSVSAEIPDKKALKVMAKARKKESKKKLP
jgi:hypothetical protein